MVHFLLFLLFFFVVFFSVLLHLHVRGRRHDFSQIQSQQHQQKQKNEEKWMMMSLFPLLIFAIIQTRKTTSLSLSLFFSKAPRRVFSYARVCV